jgi:hypothetical protein|tara:strand:- start:1765 stop:1995 length:231 start_codon:yes stop_codon:yes gene_type:complete
MGNLVTGMNPGIGSAGTDQFDRVRRYLRNCGGQLACHGTNTGFLHLPAVEPAAIVFEGKDNPALANGIVCGECLGF